MDLQKLKPWNWLKREQAQTGELLPARRETDPLARMHREMDRMFEDFFGSSTRPWSQRSGEMLLRPSVDISETKKAYKIAVEVPGIDENEIDLTVEGDALLISGEKKQEFEEKDEGFHRIERSYGHFRRVLSLPDDADADNISAEFGKGVLKIRIPRLKPAEKPGARKIEIGR